MNLELFIARRLIRGSRAESVSVPIVKIAVAGIALGVCVMLLSIFIITGFKQEITTKLSGFTAHLNVVAYDNNHSFATEAIHVNDTLLGNFRQIEGVKQAYPFITKPAILKHGEEIHGVILKGIDSTFQSEFYKLHIQEGDFPAYQGDQISDEILLSSSVARLLDLKVGDRIAAHFVQEPPRVRMFRVSGIYDTGFKEYDDIFVLCDLRHLRRLNDWEAGEVSGVAVELDNLQHIPQVEPRLSEQLPLEEGGDFYKITTLRESAPQIFDWLSLLNMNVWIILGLIVTVAGFNMVSGLLILILDKTALIGILKALGYRNLRLRRLFLYIAAGLIGRGMLVGNGLAFLLGSLQKYFHWIHLDPATYYMDTVPINFDWGYVVLLNIGVLVVSVLMLVVPTILISHIKPIKAIRFE